MFQGTKSLEHKSDLRKQQQQNLINFVVPLSFLRF